MSIKIRIWDSKGEPETIECTSATATTPPLVVKVKHGVKTRIIKGAVGFTIVPEEKKLTA